MKLFSGTSNRQLATSISDVLSIPLSQAEVERFSNSEVRVRIEDDIKNETCVVIQSTSNPTDTNLMELFFFCDALRRQEAQKVIGVIPYFGYARQDIQHREGECVSANVVIRFLESIGFNKIYTVDLHNESTEGTFSIPFKNISAMELLAQRVKTYLSDSVDVPTTPDAVAIVAPDQGAIEQGRNFGEVLFGTPDFPLAVIEKKRYQDKKETVESIDLYGDIKGKHVIIVDDMVVSGSTIVPAVDLCLDKGALAVYAAVTHHDFAEGTHQLIQDSSIQEFFTTDTIALQDNQKFNKLDEVSIAQILADELSYLK